jgi:hypothetical protein
MEKLAESDELRRLRRLNEATKSYYCKHCHQLRLKAFGAANTLDLEPAKTVAIEAPRW